MAFSLASAKVPEDPKPKPGREILEKRGTRNGSIAIWMEKVQFAHVFCVVFCQKVVVDVTHTHTHTTN